MDAATEPIVTTIAHRRRGVRREMREETVRIVEYSSFPRVEPLQELRIGFTRDLCSTGMCLGVDEREPVGTLLRLSVRDVAGKCADALIGRVMWTGAERDGRFWLGLELLTEAVIRIRSVRHAAAGAGGIAVGQSRA
jgi:hypothetical protein